MSPQTILIVFCGISLIALVINHFRKIKKFFFVILAVAVTASACWLAMNQKQTSQKSKESEASPSLPFRFIKAAENISVDSGESRIQIQVPVSGECKIICVRAVADKSDVTEQTLISKVLFSLVLKDGSRIPMSSVSISLKEEKEKSEIILKIIFTFEKPVIGENVDSLEVENTMDKKLFLSQVSIDAWSVDMEFPKK